MESILTSIKKMLGILEEYEHFDPELIIYINSVFTTLYQLGVGTEEQFVTIDKNSKWSDFIAEGNIEMVKPYVYLKVKKLFDPPANSYLMDAIDKQCAEYEWRMNVLAEEDKQ